MTKCTMCNEDTHGGNLCYLHSKYYQQITGPHFETLYDLLWWKATFLKRWDTLYGIEIPITCADHVHVQKMNKKMLLNTKLKVEFALANKTIDLSSFCPLVHKLANKFSGMSDFTEDDIYQQCMVWLQDMTQNVDERMEPKMLTTWVRKSLYGLLYNYINRHGGVVKKGSTETLGDMDCYILDKAPNQEEKLMHNQGVQTQVAAINKLADELNERQTNIIINWFDSETLTPNEFALRYGVSKQMISKDTKTILDRARELY
jgi:RNA polymerase sigma factor (sigma-70 family)